MSTKQSPISQIDRFKSAARELPTDESEEAFDRILRKVGSAKPAPVHKRSTAPKKAAKGKPAQ